MEYNPQNFNHSGNIEDQQVEVQEVLKIVFIGDSGVGKTNILNVFGDKEFNFASKSTIGVDFVMKTISYRNLYIKLQLWDTAGQERYRSFTSAYYQNSNGIIIVYDVSERQSFLNVSQWLKSIKESIDVNKVAILLIGNKNDLVQERKVSYEEGKEYALQNDMLFIETSALNNSEDKIGEAFFRVIEHLDNKYNLLQQQDNSQKIIKNSQMQIQYNQNENQPKGCCSGNQLII